MKQLEGLLPTSQQSDGKPKGPSKLMLENWKLEQEMVASTVQVHDDPPVDISVISHNSLFHVVKGDTISDQPELYGGVDVSFPGREGDKAVAVYVVIDKRNMTCVYKDHLFFDIEVPYVPTFLAFREIRPLEMLVHRQVEMFPHFIPKAILVDGNGIFHPRHAGIACFLGTRTNIPTIGIGKSLLYEGGWTRENLSICIDHFLQDITLQLDGDPTLQTQLALLRGSIIKKTSPDLTKCTNGLRYDDDEYDTNMMCDADSSSARDVNNQSRSILDRSQLLKRLAMMCNGIAIPLRGNNSDPRFSILGCAMVGHGGHSIATSSSKNAQAQIGTVKPIIVSVGHRISLPEAVRITASLSMYKIPEPVRQADLYGRQLIRQRNE